VTARSVVGVVSGLIALLAFVPYIWSCIKGVASPNRASWWIWTLVGAMTCASYYAAGARSSVWITLSFAVGPLLIAIVSVRRGTGGFTGFDGVCVIAALIAAILWWATGSPIVALVLLMVADSLGLLPTIRKTWRDPASESRLPWALWLVADALNLVAVQKWNFAQTFYPLVWVAMAATMTALTSRTVAEPEGSVPRSPMPA
jgi:hypothetical protein